MPKNYPLIPPLPIQSEQNYQDQCVTFRDKQNSSKKMSEAHWSKKTNSKGSTPLEVSHSSSKFEIDKVSFEKSNSGHFFQSNQ